MREEGLIEEPHFYHHIDGEVLEWDWLHDSACHAPGFVDSWCTPEGQKG
jgi:hypothetical protein